MTRQKVLANSAWLMGDKILRLGLGLVVWVWLARHVGPEAFGLWNYAIAFTALFGALAGLGLDGIVVRELVRDPERAGAILGTAFAMRMCAGCVAALACILAAAVLRQPDLSAVALVALNAAVLVLQSSQVIDYYFQARMRTRSTVLATNAAFLIATAIRIGLLVSGAPLLWFGASLVVEAALAAVLLCVAYRADKASAQAWVFRANVARRLLSEGWPLLLSALAVMAYMRLDQVMLSAMAGDFEVGQFSAALRISEVWYFIPMAIVTAAFPLMMQKKLDSPKAYERFLQLLYDGMAWLGVAVALLITLIGPWLIELLYGPAFGQAASILSVQAWAGVAVSMSFVHGKWLLTEGLQKYGLVYTTAGAVVNIALNVLLIPRFGALGSAWATLVTQVGLLPIQLIFPRARRNFAMMMRTLLAPRRLWLAVQQAGLGKRGT